MGPLSDTSRLAAYDERFYAQEAKLQDVTSKIDYGCLITERILSVFAAIPFFSMLAGACKIKLGGMQFVAGLCVGVSTALASHVFREKAPILGEISKRGMNHVKHGLGNIGAGLVEFVPVVGTVALIARGVVFNPKKDNQQDKLMAYSSIKRPQAQLAG
jgi:hypothetical protein